MKTAFTPGPWEACARGDYGDYNGNCRVILGDDLRVAVVLGSDADAHLIAASPDLYKALAAMVDDDSADTIDTRYENARAALAKARGESL